ncbi:MAG TPA: orotidine-5'-phosphate decarboxylase [Patescibacteria group bacterium]|nr:orotidine-5'-phosphate decarboxylase [Patescibacteria group bacterium]
MTFLEMLDGAVTKNNSLLCVGLDPDITKIPKAVTSKPNPLYTFNKAIIDATADLVCAFKLNSAFYEAYGSDGIEQLQKTCAYIHKKYPELPIILDFKRGDIGNTNNYYAEFAFDYLGVDAITISPYMGREANEPYLAYKDKGIIVLCRTSNPGAGEFQDLEVGGKKVYRIVAEEVMSKWNKNKNCLLVIGSPYPDELLEIRQALGNDAVFLIPGLGSQGGDAKKTVQAGINTMGKGIVINSSREVIYASADGNYAAAAQTKAIELRNIINKYRS